VPQHARAPPLPNSSAPPCDLQTLRPGKPLSLITASYEAAETPVGSEMDNLSLPLLKLNKSLGLGAHKSSKHPAVRDSFLRNLAQFSSAKLLL
jgi:hypothetical protein